MDKLWNALGELLIAFFDALAALGAVVLSDIIVAQWLLQRGTFGERIPEFLTVFILILLIRWYQVHREVKQADDEATETKPE